MVDWVQFGDVCFEWRNEMGPLVSIPMRETGESGRGKDGKF